MSDRIPDEPNIIGADDQTIGSQDLPGLRLQPWVSDLAPAAAYLSRDSGSSSRKRGLFEDNLALSGALGNAIHLFECERGEILGCRFVWSSNMGSPSQFIRAERAFSLLVDGSSFMGAGAGVDQRVKWGASLVNSSWARFTNNVGIDLYGTSATQGGLLNSDSDSNEVVEFGNVELKTGFSDTMARLSIAGERVFSLSRGGIELPRYSSQTALNSVNTTLLRPGAMAWVEGATGGLRVWTGGPIWRDVELV